MTWLLLLALTTITVASRTVPMALLPAPQGALADLLDGLPAPLFASLAAVAVVQDGLPSPAIMAAVVGSLVGASRRSLGLTLVCGVAGFVLVDALL